MQTWLLTGLAMADGTATLGTTQALRAGTELGVDVLAVGETIRWQGSGALGVRDPAGTVLADLPPSGELVAGSTGLWSFTVRADQTQGSAWDLDVIGAAGGRLSSTSWQFDAGSFAQAASTDASFFAKVPGGSPTTSSVIELDLDGLAGYIYDIRANRIGVSGVAGSILSAGNTVAEEFPIYLRPPESASYSREVPTVGGWSFEGALAEASIVDGSTLSCDAVRAGGGSATFSFQTDVEGTATLRCDLDLDGQFADAGTPDVASTIATSPGVQTLAWNGTDRYGNAVSAGVYPCRVEIRTGEFHYVGNDIETSYPGLRLFEVRADGSRGPLQMVWDDTRVQDAAVLMPNGEYGLAESPVGGMASGAYGEAAVPNVNARSWGEFAGSGKGNQAFLDTATWLESATSTSIQVRVYDGTEDADGDGLSDFDERCVVGSDPDVPDTDGDGSPDGEQYGAISSAFDGGLESNGAFAEAIAMRHVQRTRYGASPAQLRSTSALWGWLPEVGPLGSVRVNVTPDDLLGTTEADDVVAADYLSNGRRVAALLLIGTTSRHYSHTKAICDRAGGKVLADVRLDPRSTHHQATLVDPATGQRDHTSTWVAIEQPGGSWSLHSSWLVDDLPRLVEGQRAVQIQAWTASPGVQDALLRQVQATLDAEWGATTEPVAGYFRSVASWGDTLDVAGPDGWRVRGRTEEGEVFEVDQGEPLPVFSEASIELWQGDQLVDRAWVSDGSWLALDAASVPCSPRTDRPEGLALHGCGATASGGAVARTLQPARRLVGTLSVHASAGAEVCVESAAVGSFACAPLQAGWNDVALDAMTGDPDALAQADLLVFRPAERGEQLVVSGLTLSPRGPETEGERVGCAHASAGVVGWFAVLFAFRRRADRS